MLPFLTSLQLCEGLEQLEVWRQVPVTFAVLLQMCLLLSKALGDESNKQWEPCQSTMLLYRTTGWFGSEDTSKVICL